METVLLLALAAAANPAQLRESHALKEPLQQRATTAGINKPSEASVPNSAHYGATHNPRMLRRWALPGHYIDVVLMCEQNYAELAKSLAGSIGTVRSRLHCGQTLLTERLRASGLNVADTAVGEDDGCAL